MSATSPGTRNSSIPTAGDEELPAEVTLVIGKPNLDIAMWDVDNPQWATRYKRPFLVLRSSDKATEAVCAFDVLSGRAEIVEGERS